MALQKFPVETLHKVRQHICTQLILPPSEQHPLKGEDRVIEASRAEPASLNALGDLFRAGGFIDDEAPSPNDQGKWFLSTVDPAAAINKLPGIALKPGVRLVTYLQRRPNAGMGVTWALPDLMSTTTQLEAALETAGSGSIPPHPKGALSHVMDSIEGQHTSPSYIVASLLLRELKELGRIGHNSRWAQHRIIAGVPAKPIWQWRSQTPKDLSPKVRINPDQAVWVEFFSFRRTAPVALFRHLDHYDAQSYRPKTQDQLIATSEMPLAKALARKR